MGTKTWPCYNQNHVIMSSVIKGLKCIENKNEKLFVRNQCVRLYPISHLNILDSINSNQLYKSEFLSSLVPVILRAGSLFVCSGLTSLSKQFLFWFNVTFKKISVLSQWCLVAPWSSVLTFIVLPCRSIMPQTLDSHIILTLGRLVLALPRKSECQALAASTIFNSFRMLWPGIEPVTSCYPETFYQLSYRGHQGRMQDFRKGFAFRLNLSKNNSEFIHLNSCTLSPKFP